MDGSNWKSVFQSLHSCWQKPTGVELNGFYYYAVIITNFSSSTTRREVRCKRVSPKAPHQWGCQLASTEQLSLHIKLQTALQNCIGSCFYLMSRAGTNWEKCLKMMYKEYSHMDYWEGIDQIWIKMVKLLYISLKIIFCNKEKLLFVFSLNVKTVKLVTTLSYNLTFDLSHYFLLHLMLSTAISGTLEFIWFEVCVRCTHCHCTFFWLLVSVTCAILFVYKSCIRLI